jgi:hypothetical protein
MLNYFYFNYILFRSNNIYKGDKFKKVKYYIILESGYTIYTFSLHYIFICAF